MKIQLPAHINADGLLPFLAQLGAASQADAVDLDFSQLRRVSPAAMVALAAQVSAWRMRGASVSVGGLEHCGILSYLQRMDLLTHCGICVPEKFHRHDARGRFVPVRKVEHPVEEMGSQMALCVAPGGDDYEHPLAGLYDLIWYVLTEMSNNVRQHSGGTGYASAQVSGLTEGLVRVAIADSGRGILASFREAGFDWSHALDDRAAILKALEPKVSSKGSPANEGVGLTLTSKLAEQVGAWLLIVSGDGAVRMRPKQGMRVERLPGGERYGGTLVALTFPQGKAQNFPELLDLAKQASGLLQPKPGRGRFTP